MRNEKTYYDILGVTRSADDAVIVGAYKALAKKFHPDKIGLNEASNKQMSEINLAYSILSDKVKRREYDLSLAKEHPNEDLTGNTNHSKKKKNGSSRSSDQPRFDDPNSIKWSTILSYNKHIESLYNRLHLINPTLGYNFKEAMMNCGDFNRATVIARDFEYEYFANDLDHNDALIMFSTLLHLSRNYIAANDLKNLLSYLNYNYDANTVMKNIEAKHNLTHLGISKKVMEEMSKSTLQEKEIEIYEKNLLYAKIAVYLILALILDKFSLDIMSYLSSIGPTSSGEIYRFGFNLPTVFMLLPALMYTWPVHTILFRIFNKIFHRYKHMPWIFNKIY